MQPHTLTAWNGIRLSIPSSWEPRVAATSHLVFEEDFQPLLQLRWYKQSGSSSKESLGLAAALAGQGERAGAGSDFSPAWRQLESAFQVLAFAGKSGTPTGGALACPHCHTVFHFQLFPDRIAMGDTIAGILLSLSCHDHDDDLWRIQDFSLSLPPGFVMTGYSFATGLTRLSFTTGRIRLEAARLAPADQRLKEQSLAEILAALTAVAGLRTATVDSNACEGYRAPGIYRRFSERLRGGRPFVRARLSHVRNRLLALVLSGVRPLPDGLLSEIAEGYGIV